MRRAGALGVLLMAIAGACGLGGPARVIGTERLQNDLTDAVSEDYGVEALEVTCPEEVEAAAGTTFTCEVEVNKGSLSYEVTQTDADGSLTFSATEAVVPAEVPAAQIVAHYNEQVGKNVEVFCGQREIEVRVAAPGESFVCRVVDRQGATDGAVVTVTDLDGAFTFEIRPGDAAGAEY